MKKYLLTALCLLSLSVLRAGGLQVDSPRGDPQALATADYGGVYVATAAFSLNFTTACIPCKGVFHGILFSSGALQSYDFVDVYDASTTYNANLNSLLIARVYNVSGSTMNTAGANTAGSASGWNGTPKPIRFSKGLIFKANSAAYNLIDCLWWGTPETPATSYYQGY